MKPQPRTDGEVLETPFGPNGRAARVEIGRDGRIAQLTPLVGSSAGDGPVVMPGLFDLQVNGFAGVDFNVPGLTADRMDHALSAMLSTGVTRCLPTLITNGPEQLIALLRTLDAAVSASDLGPVMVPGYHIEGPFLSPLDGYAGAHPAAQMQRASPALVDQLQAAAARPIVMMTVAPEVAGVLDLIPVLVERGIACALGHTAASRGQIDDAIGAGATVSTHLGNGLPHLLDKNANAFVIQLSRDQLMASFIADGIHIASDILQSWLRAKTLDRSIIVTDATAAARAPAHTSVFTLGTGTIERHDDGSVRLPGSNYLAGSAAGMDEMVRNVMAWYGYTAADVLRLARHNPLRAARLPVGEMAAGDPADFVEWDVRDGQMRDGQMYVARSHIGPWTLRSEDGNNSMRSA